MIVYGEARVSEYQNNAVRLAVAQLGESQALDLARLRVHLLDASIALHRLLGGSMEDADHSIQRVYSEPRGEIADRVAEIMSALAGVSQANDIDMMQAAYNLVDRERAALGKPRKT